MHIGYDWNDYENSGLGHGLFIKAGFTVEWDKIAFWRIFPHKHIPQSDSLLYFMWKKPGTIVNQRCSKCLRWYVLSTGKLHRELNRGER